MSLKKLLLERASLLSRLDKLDETLRDLEPLLPPPPRLGPDGELYSELVVEQSAKGGKGAKGGARGARDEGLSGDGLRLRQVDAYDAMEMRAKIYARKGLLSEALAAFEELVRVYPRRPEAFLALASLRADRGEVDHELAALRSASLLLPLDLPLAQRVAAAYHKAASLGIKERIPPGITHMTALLERGAGVEINVIRAGLRVSLAGMLSGAEEQSPLYDSACADLSTVIKDNPRHAEALLSRGCLEGKTNRKRAMDDLAYASALLPEDPRGPMARGLLLESGGDGKGALLEYNEAAKRTNRGFPLVAAALVYLHFLHKVRG